MRPKSPRVAARRRWLAAAGAVIVVALGAVGAMSLGSGGAGPSLGLGTGQDAVLPGTQPGHSLTAPVHTPPFTPAPASVRIAASLPLGGQVAQLFLVSLDGTDASAVGPLGAINWGGIAFDSSNLAPDAQVGALTADAAAAARGGGGLAPLIAVAPPGGPGTAFGGLPPEAEPTVAASGQAQSAYSQARLAAGG